MKGLSICQPYPFLIMLPMSDPRHKRIENRKWNYVPDWTGDLAIHASQSRKYFRAGDLLGPQSPEMYFGAVVGVAHLAGAFRLEDPLAYTPEWAAKRWPWVEEHSHLEGPVCLVLEHVRKLTVPLQFRGALGFFEVPDELIAGRELVNVNAAA